MLVNNYSAFSQSKQINFINFYDIINQQDITYYIITIKKLNTLRI